MKGECQNADGDWQKVEYNDFATLAAKLSGKPANTDHARLHRKGC